MTACLMIELQAVPERVPSARGAITRLCEDLEIEEDLAGQIRLAVTEACTNCVLHAYADESGTDATFALEARVEDDDLLVVVRDAGAGITAVALGAGGPRLRAAAHAPGRLEHGRRLAPRRRHVRRDALRDSLRLVSRPAKGGRKLRRAGHPHTPLAGSRTSRAA